MLSHIKVQLIQHTPQWLTYPMLMLAVLLDREFMTLSTEYMLMGVLYCLFIATGTVLATPPPGTNGFGATL